MGERPSNRISNGAKANWNHWKHSYNNCQANDETSFKLEIEVELSLKSEIKDGVIRRKIVIYIL